MLLLVLVVLDHTCHRPGPASQPAAPDDLARYHNRTFRVTKVVDGDTLQVDAPDGASPHTTIRLWGVDTPEVHGVEIPDYFGPEASAFSHSVADEQLVRLELLPDHTRDRYRRLLAYVHLPDGTMLNERLIEGGYAYADTRFAHPLKARFGQLERRARRQGVGLWPRVTPERMPAWRRQREKASASAAASRRQLPRTPECGPVVECFDLVLSQERQAASESLASMTL
jgi:micrococcal nuclease